MSGIFLLGLGLGSLWAGRFIDRKNALYSNAGLRYYAWSEVLIAAFGLFSVFVMPHLEGLSPLISSYYKADNGWMELTTSSYLFRYAIAIFLIAPMTVIMGATLTFLIRFLLSSSTDQAGWKIGALYGINTLGAAVGCAAVDLWAVPSIGLLKTKLFAVLLNCIASGAAFLLLKSLPSSAVSNSAPRTNSAPAIWPGAASLFISGFCAMGIEMVWFRFLSGLFSSRRIAFSLLLVTMLTGMWLGGLIAGWLSRQSRNSAGLFISSQLLLAISVLGGFFLFIHTDRIYFLDAVVAFASSHQENWLFSLVDVYTILIPAMKVTFIPAVLMGVAYPLINALFQRKQETAGETAGRLYFWNTAGALLGSLTAGFVLLPVFGMQSAVSLLVCGSIIAILPIYWTFIFKELKFRLYQRQILFLAFVFIGVFGVWFSQSELYLVTNMFLQDSSALARESLIHVSEGVNEIAVITETNSEDKGRILYTNGHPMSGTGYRNQRYMRAFVHLPLLQLENPESVLVICFGVGNTLQAASLHPSILKLDVVDLSKNVLSQAPFFEKSNNAILKDPRVQVFINDGRQHLQMQAEGSYDLITLEPPPLTNAGVASLYSLEFYKMAFRALKSKGFMTQWLPIYQIDGEHTRQLVKAFLDVFPNGVLIEGLSQELILMGQKDGPNQINWKDVERRIGARTDVKKDLEKINLANPVEWLGTFMSSGKWLAANLTTTKPLIDDNPIIEYNHFLFSTTLPKELFNTSTFADWCPSCFEKGKMIATLEPLPSYLYLMQRIYSQDSFNQISPFPKTFPNFDLQLNESVHVSTPEDVLSAPSKETYNKMLVSYPYLQRVFGLNRL